MSILIGQKLVENAEIEKFKWDILVIFKHCDIGEFSNNLRNEQKTVIVDNSQVNKIELW